MNNYNLLTNIVLVLLRCGEDVKLKYAQDSFALLEQQGSLLLPDDSDRARAMLVPTTNQKRAATSSSLSVEEVEEGRPVLPTRIVVNGDRTRASD